MPVKGTVPVRERENSIVLDHQSLLVRSREADSVVCKSAEYSRSNGSFTLQAEPSRAELNRAGRVTIHIASRADPN